MRSVLRSLEILQVIVRLQRDSLPRTIEYDLTEAGRELLGVADRLGDWLAEAPQPLQLGTDRARAAVRAFVEAWLARMLKPLAEGPLSLTELDKRLNSVSYPMIERRLEMMLLAEQLDVGVRTSCGTPYIISPWLRRAVAPLVAAARWEHRNPPPDAEPITRLEIEAALTLAEPLLQLPSSASGICEMSVWIDSGGKKYRYSLGIDLPGDGTVGLAPPNPNRKPDCQASGTGNDWFAAVVDGDRARLRIKGNGSLPGALLDSIHQTLFAGVARAIPI